MRNLRWRIARWLVGPFVNLPERKGAWIVMRYDGGGTAMVEAETLRLTLGTALPSFDLLPSFAHAEFGITHRSTGRFAGTIKA